MNELEYKGLILKQNTYNCHYVIIDKKTNETLMYCSCNKKLTKNQMKKSIERLILIRESLNDYLIHGNGEKSKGLMNDLVEKVD